MLYRPLAQLARGCTIAGAVAILIMMIGTDWDILARRIAGRPLNGVVELVEISMLAVAMLGLPEAFLRDEHIRIDLLDAMFSAAVLSIVKGVGLALSVLFLTLLSINVWPRILDALAFGDLKYDLGVPIWPLYALVFFSFTASILTCVALFWAQFFDGEASS